MLTNKDKEDILKSFKEWSDGLEPSESSPDDLEVFSSHWSGPLDQDAVLNYLIDLQLGN